MNFDEMSPYVQEFLASFFGPGNGLRLEQFGRKTLSFLKPWLRALDDQRHPVLLPRVDTKRETTWYAIAFSERRARELKEELTAFVGPTYSDFDGRIAELDPEDPTESSFEELQNATVFSFRVDADDQKTVRKVLSQMRNLWEVRPKRTAIKIRTTSRLIRDFEMALEVLNESTARKHLATLRTEGRLSSQNYLFLKLRLLAAFRRWEDILTMRELPAVLDLKRRPQLVNQALIQALYATELEQFEITERPEQAVNHFRNTVLFHYPQLFKSRGALTAPEVLKSFMMLAAVSTPPRPAARDEILAEYPNDAADRDYVESLANRVADETEPVADDVEQDEQKPLALAQDAQDRHDFDQALKHLKSAENSKKRLELMLGCAYEINTLEAARATLEAFADAPGETVNEVLATRQAEDLWEKLTELVEPSDGNDNSDSPSETLPDSWSVWLRKLNDEGSWSSALQVAEQGSLEWDHTPLKTSPEMVREIADLLELDRQPEAQAVLRNAVPHMLRFFLPNGEPQPQYREIYFKLMDVLAFDSRLGQDDLTALQDLTVALLEDGLTESEYSEVVDLLKMVWEVYKAPANTDWVLDLLDVLLAYPCRNQEERAQFFSLVIATIQGFARRVRTEQWSLLELLCEDFGSPEALDGVRPEQEPDEEEGSESVAQRLRGKQIAIYTLTESASRRVSRFLRQEYDDVSVTVSNAHGGTDRLQKMARSADIFLVATRSAKHAATEFIDANRPSNKPTLFPVGKGSSSMLRKLFDYLEE